MRLKLSEISFLRIVNAFTRRIKNIPFKLTYVFSEDGKQNRKRIKRVYNLYKDQTCVLLANGPSLKNEDLSITNKFITFGLNRIYVGFEKMNFKLDYLVCINKLVAKQFCHEIDSLDCTKFLYWNSKKYYKSSQKTLWLHQGLSNDIFSTDLSKSINPAATVTYAALQVIYYMGFKKVIILGLDHNFQLDKSKIPNTTEKYTHQKDVNHFIDNYFPKGTKWETPDLYSSEFFYKKARKYFEDDGRKIFDCTKNGKCDVFIKKSIDTVLEQSIN